MYHCSFPLLTPPHCGVSPSKQAEWHSPFNTMNFTYAAAPTLQIMVMPPYNLWWCHLTNYDDATLQIMLMPPHKLCWCYLTALNKLAWHFPQITCDCWQRTDDRWDLDLWLGHCQWWPWLQRCSLSICDQRCNLYWVLLTCLSFQSSSLLPSSFLLEESGGLQGLQW